MKRVAGKRRQRGAALILMATVLILGVGWYTVRALATVVPANTEREVKTALALQAGKQALLAYVAQYAARHDTADRGQLPCPESLALSNPGVSATSCSASALVVGRLPWKTLGVDQLLDGEGEPLWYMMRGFRDPPINLGTAGQLSHNGNAVVAIIVAPGRPLNTASTAGAPPGGCNQQNQMVGGRNTGPLNAANFLECGVATGSVTTPGDATWTNDRVISISAAEWADAISPAIADRLQRQVAPAMQNFYTTTSLASWGQRYFPNASTFDNPATNDLCGNVGVREGMPPTATVASGTCSTDWDSAGASGLGALLAFGGCTPWSASGPPTEIHCNFFVLLGVTNPTITLSAPRVGYAFRAVDASQIRVEVNGPLSALPLLTPPATTTNHDLSVSAADGRGTYRFDVVLSGLGIGLLDTVRVRIPYPTDALLADTASAWYVINQWDRFTYYGVARPQTSDPAGTCTTATTTDCLTVEGMPAPNNDKRLVLLLRGRALAGQVWGDADPINYFESLATPANPASNTTLADRNYTSATVTSTFNDRVAACPFQLTPASGTPLTICN